MRWRTYFNSLSFKGLDFDLGFSGGIDSLGREVDCSDGSVLGFSGEIDFLLIVADGSVRLTLIFGFSGGG